MITNEELVALIKADPRIDKRLVALIKRDLSIEAILTDAEVRDFDDPQRIASLNDYARECRDLIARNDWTAEQFITNRIPPIL